MFTKMKYFLFTLLLLTAGGVYAAPAPAAKIDYFFEQTADSAVLTPVANKPGSYVLTLKKVLPYIHYISLRPDRMTGIMPTGKFFSGWREGKNSFSKDAPNVSLAGLRLHGTYKNKIVSYSFALDHPHYNQSKNEITYDAQSLQNENNLPSNKEITLQNVVLFLDSGWCPGCCCG